MYCFIASLIKLSKENPIFHRRAAAYIRFLELTRSMQEASTLPALDPLEQRIFRVVARAGYDKARLSVRDLIGNRDLGSLATVHSRLKSMRAKGWIALADTEDGRRKQVELTEAALQLLDEVGARIVEAAQENVA